MRGVNKSYGDSSSDNNMSRPVTCKHKVRSIIQTSSTEKNPGRKFHRCPYWKDRDFGFFKWVDGTTTESNFGRIESEGLQLKLQDMELTMMALEEAVRVAEEKAERRKLAKHQLQAELRISRAEFRKVISDIQDTKLVVANLETRVYQFIV
ncbi:hypothetical protein LINPERHAP2_LOCUS3326, partial [Linum perenne]